ncbi:MAG: DUF3320 domain-containing protein, partial [Deltaproteobacteria bacterium]
PLPTLWLEPDGAADVQESVRIQSVVTSNPDAFFEPHYADTLAQMVADITAVHGPLPLASLARRVAQSHGWQRTGHRIATRVETALSAVERHTDLGTEFVWSTGTYANRIPARPLGERAIREVHPAEIATTIEVHAEAIIAAEDPMLDLARRLGIARLSQDARDYLEACVEWCDQ